VTLSEIRKIDLIVCGSVAVNRQVARVGKGGGYSDLNRPLTKKKLGPKIRTVTSVHPLQIIDEEISAAAHDIPLTAIVTPDEVVKLAYRWGIDWKILPQEKIDAIPILNGRKRTARK
jgi:5-formyltetrahydrofolate cyclo-ligase